MLAGLGVTDVQIADAPRSMAEAAVAVSPGLVSINVGR